MEVKFLIQLKLEADITNELEYVRVIVPFHNRPKIGQIIGAATAGEVHVREDKRAILWNIGAKERNEKEKE